MHSELPEQSSTQTPVAGVIPTALVRVHTPSHVLGLALGVQGVPTGSPAGGLVFEHRPRSWLLSQYNPLPHSTSERQCGTQNVMTELDPKSMHTKSERPAHLVCTSVGSPLTQLSKQ
jgi:hypothetical protein